MAETKVLKWTDVKHNNEVEIDITDRAPGEYQIPALTLGIEAELITGLVPHERREGKGVKHVFEERSEEEFDHRFDGDHREFRERQVGTQQPAEIEAIFKAFSEDLVTPEAIRDIIEVKNALPDADPAIVVDDLYHTVKKVVAWLAQNDREVLPFALHPLAVTHPISSYDFIRDLAKAKHGAGSTRLAGNASTQVNVAIEDGNAAVFTYKALSGISAIILALTSNSPFHASRFTGVLSMRPNVRAALLDSGWVCEDIPEQTVGEYFDNRRKMCGIGAVMSRPWAHNGPMRIRPDRKFCIEFAQPDFVPSFKVLGDLTRFLQALVRRVLIAYKQSEPLPACLGSRLILAQQKNVQEAAIRGKDGMFIDADLNIVPMQQAIVDLVQWVGGEYSMLFAPTPAESMVAKFKEIHNHCVDDYVDGCDLCASAIFYIAEEESRGFSAKFQGLWEIDNIPLRAMRASASV